ncbi:MAG: DEAD/DEAH box helicase, partial [Alphaproteobacteria bacterium]|nr:DEAD/DEAH box helicase [Alphaproteobacteria bacterium]
MTNHTPNNDLCDTRESVDNSMDNVMLAFTDDAYGVEPAATPAPVSAQISAQPATQPEESLLAKSAAKGVKFSDFALPPAIRDALARMNYETPTKIQAMAIPFALQGRDILGSAQTGTGKTAAFSIPMVSKLMANPNAMALVLAPTRELAAQTLDVVRKITNGQRDMKAALLIGGEGMGKQFDQLRQNPRIIIGTPGRINDHLRRNPKMLRNVNFVAIDEADRMLDMGFAPQIDEILKNLPKERQTLMFSATFPEGIIRLSRSYLNNPERVAVSTEKVNAPKIKHEMIRIADSEKYGGLVDQLELRQGSILIFVKTQHGTERLAKRLDNDNLPSIVIHGGLRQAQRDRAVREFRQQRSRILIATDVASRGLDIPHIEHVINYDLPQVAEDYIHRIGRTGRNGAEGQAMCFVIPSEMGKWNAINRILNPGAAPERKERSEGGQGRGGPRPARGNGERSYKNASGFNNRKPKGDRFEGRSENRDGGRYESRSAGRTEKQDFRDGDFRDNRGADRDFRGRDFREAPQREAKRTPTDRNWNAKEGRKEYKSDFRNEGRGEYRPAPRRDDRSEGRPEGRGEYRPRTEARPAGRFEERSERRPAPRRDDNRSSYRGARNDNVSNEGRNYNEGRGDGYEGQDRNSFGVKPRNGNPAAKVKKATPGKKPFVF